MENLETKEKYIVYLTKNKVNNKIYVGIHKTDNPYCFDGYLGNGVNIYTASYYKNGETAFRRALLKYGTDNFERITLKVCDDLESAQILENLIVDENFIQREDTYNMTIGGGIPPIKTTIVYQFDLNGNMIKKWDSVIDVLKHYMCNKDRIRMCIRDKRSFDNSYWSYNDNIDVSQYRLSSRGYVYKYDLNGKLVTQYKNATEASLCENKKAKNIIYAISFKRPYCGYYYLKPNDDIVEVISNYHKISCRRMTKICKYDSSNNLICKYNSMSSVLREFGLKSKNKLIKAIVNNSELCGFFWKYEHD